MDAAICTNVPMYPGMGEPYPLALQTQCASKLTGFLSNKTRFSEHLPHLALYTGESPVYHVEHLRANQLEADLC